MDLYLFGKEASFSLNGLIRFLKLPTIGIFNIPEPVESFIYLLYLELDFKE